MNFGDENIVCFIGRGDSGKTTVSEAISSALSSSWNLTFHDSDFYNCDLNNPISIEVSVIDIPEKKTTTPIDIQRLKVDCEFMQLIPS